jgi:hypothetical protein
VQVLVGSVSRQVRRVARSRLAAAAVATWLLAACVFGDNVNQDIALGIDPHGRPTIVGAKCGMSGPVIVSVYLGAASEPRTLIWQIQAADGRDPVEVVVGTTPDGYTETVRLGAPLDPGATYLAEISYPSKPAGDDMQFTPSSLPRDGLIDQDGALVTWSEFTERRTLWC